MYPVSRTVDPTVKEPAGAYLQQALDALHAPAGAVMLAASAVDAMLKERGYAEGKLNDRINKAAEDHLITSAMAEWAHEVRLDANAQRHADQDIGLPKEEDATQTVEFALALAHYLFVLPDRVKQRGKVGGADLIEPKS
jgi:hypothetical protein